MTSQIPDQEKLRTWIEQHSAIAASQPPPQLAMPQGQACRCNHTPKDVMAEDAEFSQLWPSNTQTETPLPSSTASRPLRCRPEATQARSRKAVEANQRLNLRNARGPARLAERAAQRRQTSRSQADRKGKRAKLSASVECRQADLARFKAIGQTETDPLAAAEEFGLILTSSQAIPQDARQTECAQSPESSNSPLTINPTERHFYSSSSNDCPAAAGRSIQSFQADVRKFSKQKVRISNSSGSQSRSRTRARDCDGAFQVRATFANPEDFCGRCYADRKACKLAESYL